MDDDPDMASVPQEPTSDTFSVATTITGHSCIPQMQLPFLSSSFFRRFCVQRPIIEPGEFVSRYIAHLEGNVPLDMEGRMLAMVLVTWAASFGIDEYGGEDTQDGASDSHGNPHFSIDGDHLSHSKRARLLRTEAMVKEILTLVDLHGLLRSPSWDGVRVLLLLLPLTHGIQSPLERLAIHEATLSQARLLCSLNDAPSVNSGLGPYCDVLVRARIFFSAHILEGITTALDGGRLVMNDDDLTAFQHTLPPQYCASASHSITTPADSPRSSPSSPVSPTFPFTTPLESNDPRAALAYMVVTQYSSLALAVSQTCRAIHFTLTGPRARQRIEINAAVRKEAVIEIWDELERCWDSFEALRRNPSGVGTAGGDIIRGEDVERFVSGWQVFIFGCLNVIREALPCPTENNHSTHEQADMVSLRLSATRRCQKYLPRVIEVLQRHLRVPSSFFAYDTGLIRDGCFFAGLLLARSDKLAAERDMMGWDADWEEGVAACLEALREVRWVYFFSQEREKTLKAEWEARIERDTHQQSPRPFPIKQSPSHSPCLSDSTPLPSSNPSTSKPRALSLFAAGGQVRPLLPPLSVSFPHDDSGPSTALTDDGSGGWEPYTPPSTAGSLTATGVAHPSLSPISSPLHPTLGLTPVSMKNGLSIFGDDSDADLFSFNVDGTPNSRTSVVSGGRARWTPFNGDYLDPRVILTTSFGV
jgi:hypothetical protein